MFLRYISSLGIHFYTAIKLNRPFLKIVKVYAFRHKFLRPQEQTNNPGNTRKNILLRKHSAGLNCSLNEFNKENCIYVIKYLLGYHKLYLILNITVPAKRLQHKTMKM